MVVMLFDESDCRWRVLAGTSDAMSMVLMGHAHAVEDGGLLRHGPVTAREPKAAGARFACNAAALGV